MSEVNKTTENKNLTAGAQSKLSTINTEGVKALSDCFSSGLIHVADCCMRAEDRAKWQLAIKTLRTIIHSSIHGLAIETGDEDVDELVESLMKLSFNETKLFELEV